MDAESFKKIIIENAKVGKVTKFETDVIVSSSCEKSTDFPNIIRIIYNLQKNLYYIESEKSLIANQGLQERYFIEIIKPFIGDLEEKDIFFEDINTGK